jgi:hypothetical protein
MLNLATKDLVELSHANPRLLQDSVQGAGLQFTMKRHDTAPVAKAHHNVAPALPHGGKPQPRERR